MTNWPRISIVTPSYNQSLYIEDTIKSVIGQNYPNLEYIIIDGGSTDESISIIKNYADNITYWVSEKDSGQADAINKGFNLATGDILGWINSDDIYMPNSFFKIANIFLEQKKKLFLLSGNAIHFGVVDKEVFSYGSDVFSDSKTFSIELMDYIIQPSSFWTKEAWQSVGLLNKDYHFAFDWEWFIRAKHTGIHFFHVSGAFALYRIHASQKTNVGKNLRQNEIYEIYDKYSNKEIADLYTKVCCDIKTFYNPNLLFKIFKKIVSFFAKSNTLVWLLVFKRPFFYTKFNHQIIRSLLKMR